MAEQRIPPNPLSDPEAQRLAAVDRATLTPLVRQALGREQAEVTGWACAPIYGGAGAGGSIYRFSGTARDRREEDLPWSLVLKAIHAIPQRRSPSAFNYWRREPEAYRSGLLYDLPGGMTAPRCYGVVEYADDACWLWLEEVEDRFGAWPIEQYGVVARHLGQLNGAYLAGRPLPEAPWLSQKWMRSYIEPAARFARSSADPPPSSRRCGRRPAGVLGEPGALPIRPGTAAAHVLPPRCLSTQPVCAAGARWPRGDGRRGLVLQRHWGDR
jgi:hypothetical protein